MTASIPFEVQIGRHSEAQALYLPYGTRTLRIAVTNNTGQAGKLWLRPDNTPANYRSTGIIRGYGDGDQDLWIHWAGGDEVGACVKTDEKSPLRDHSLKVWEVTPVPLDKGETHSVFVNVTHRTGDVKVRTLALRAITMEGEKEQSLDSTLKIHLEVPSAGGSAVQDPVQGVWNDSGTRLEFKGTQLPNYVSRWWPPAEFDYKDAGDLPGRLAMQLNNDRLTLTLDGDTLAEVLDHDWEPGQDIHRIRPALPELFHFCGNQYYVVRLWFLWLDKGIGEKHEVPDAERVDIVFDTETNAVAHVARLGTDFHYQETWGRLKAKETVGKVELGLGVSSYDDFVKTLLADFFSKSQTDNPAAEVMRELCGVPVYAAGPKAHVPLLTNVDVFRHITSLDVRET